jgi:hypothetical protein
MDLDGMIYTPSFMQIDRGFQAVAWFCLSKLEGCTVGITDGKVL